MKNRLLFLSAFLLMFIIGIADLNARTYVLVTGVSNYTNGSRSLTQSTKDAKLFRDVMLTQTKDVSLLTGDNVTPSAVIEKLRALGNRAQKGDRIVFYYSGHGGPGYLATNKGKISYDDIVNVLTDSKASEKFCFIDACFSGTMAGSLSADPWKRSVDGVALFLASRPDETSAESPLVGAGLFTQSLLKGIQGMSDKNSDRNVTVEELFRYIYGDVVRRTKDLQHPMHPQLIAPRSMYDVVVTRW